MTLLPTELLLPPPKYFVISRRELPASHRSQARRARVDGKPDKRNHHSFHQGGNSRLSNGRLFDGGLFSWPEPWRDRRLNHRHERFRGGVALSWGFASAGG